MFLDLRTPLNNDSKLQWLQPCRHRDSLLLVELATPERTETALIHSTLRWRDRKPEARLQCEDTLQSTHYDIRSQQEYE